MEYKTEINGLAIYFIFNNEPKLQESGLVQMHGSK